VILSVASGKGGTGKTTVATNLALVLGSRDSRRVTLLDCDVEEPNAGFFLQPALNDTETVGIPVPEVDLEKCNFCGRCAEVCAFNAMAVVKDRVLVFPELCHGCGACSTLCPENAIREVERPVGRVRSGKAGDLAFVQGELNVGEPMAPPVIRAVKRHIDPGRVNIIDAPPGTSCPAIEAVRGSDFVLLVTEPTPFGLNDLRIAVSMIRRIGLPYGVAINQADIGDDSAERYCREESIEVLGRIPHDRRIAVLYSKGVPAAEDPRFRPVFEDLWAGIERRVAG
jgi:MinD superfamily P-loop ATPase